MKPGDTVLVTTRGVGRVLEVYESGSVLVDLGEGDKPRRWAKGSVRAARVSVGPRGVTKVNARAARAAALRAEGRSYPQIAADLGTGEAAVRAMLAKVREAQQEERNRRHFG